jgi:hypothetical protein
MDRYAKTAQLICTAIIPVFGMAGLLRGITGMHEDSVGATVLTVMAAIMTTSGALLVREAYKEWKEK